MITVSTNANKAVPVSREALQLLCAAGLVHYSIERMRFEGVSTRVSPFVIETFVRQISDAAPSRLTRETD